MEQTKNSFCEPFYYTRKANIEIEKTRKEVEKIEQEIIDIQFKMLRCIR